MFSVIAFKYIILLVFLGFGLETRGSISGVECISDCLENKIRIRIENDSGNVGIKCR